MVHLVAAIPREGRESRLMQALGHNSSNIQGRGLVGARVQMTGNVLLASGGGEDDIAAVVVQVRCRVVVGEHQTQPDEDSAL